MTILSLFLQEMIAMKASLFLATIFATGCSFGTPVYVKHNDNGAFVLTQEFNNDILCVKDKDFKRSGKLRCYYVTEQRNKEKR